MNKLKLVIAREFLSRVRKRSFWVMTLLFPIIMLGVSIVPILLAQSGTDSQRVAIIDHTGKYLSLFKDRDAYTFVTADRSIEGYKAADRPEDITAILEIRQDLLEEPSAISLFSFKQLPRGLEDYINTTLSSYLTDQKISSYQIPGLKEAIAESKVNISVTTYKWNEEGDATTSSSAMASIIGMGLTLLSYMFIMTYGGMVLQGVQEEKKSRILEIMVSSVKPKDLMMGKIIGIGLAGIVQIFVWIVMLTAGGIALQSVLGMSTAESTGAMTPASTSEMIQALQALRGVNFVEIILCFVLFFVGGYLFYASILAALSATVSSDEDSSQLMIPVLLIMVFSIYVGMASADNPDGALAFWCSMIPITSPVVIMVRLPFEVPLWQVVLSLVLLFLSFLGTSYFGGKIYRIGILMYGKKPSLKELWRWAKYK